MAEIELDDQSSAFYKGVAAGIAAQERMTADGWDGADAKTRRAIYWFQVGTAFEEHQAKVHGMAGQVDAFIQGAAMRQP